MAESKPSLAIQRLENAVELIYGAQPLARRKCVAGLLLTVELGGLCAQNDARLPIRANGLQAFGCHCAMLTIGM